MRMKSLVLAGLGVAGMALAATSAQAAPTGGMLAAVDRSAERASPIENVTWYGWRHRHCHWHYGYRRCYGYYPYRSWDYGYYRPYRYSDGYWHPYRYRYGGY